METRGSDLNCNDPNFNDPNSSSIFLVGAIGSLILVATVCFASGLFYGMEREAGEKTESAASPFVETTVIEPRVRLEGWSKRLDEETGIEYDTLPIERAMRLVQGELQSGQGR